MKTASSNHLRSYIDLTTSTIDRRTFHFRNSVIAVALVMFSAVALPIILHTWRLFTILLLLPLIVNVFIIADSMIVSSWRCKLVSSWAAGAIDIMRFEQSISMMKHLPRKTIDGMLRMLPLKCIPHIQKECSTKPPIAETIIFLSKMQLIAGITTLSISLILTTSVAAALLALTLYPLQWMIPVIPVVIIRKVIGFIAVKRFIARVVQMLINEKIERTNYTEAVQLLEWEPYNDKQRNKILNLLTIAKHPHPIKERTL